MKLILLLVVVLGASLALEAQSKSITAEPQPLEPLVQTSLGQIRGVTLKSRAGRDYAGFLGVPYALPPVGPLRFQIPYEALPWDGTLNATVNPPVCIQHDQYSSDFVTTGSEDCLRINIFTPKNLSDPSNLFPVMFYIHGGGPYESGSQYNADYYMDEDVVLVFVNYRLGVMGNLNTNNYNARGNQGSKDQVMALRWVQKNIRAFGGDESRVTIFGNSFGGMAITGLLLSPMSEGLFHRAIAQSGTLLTTSIISVDTLGTAQNLAAKFGCRSNSSVQIPVCLQNVDASTLVLESVEMMFFYSVENYVDDGNVFLPDTPINLLQAGRIHPVTAMFGVTSGELLSQSLMILAIESELEKWNVDWITNALDFMALPASDPVTIVNEAKEFYIGPGNLSRAGREGFTNMMSDRMFVHPANVMASYQLAASSQGQDVFLYYWDYEAEYSHASAMIDMYGRDEGFMGASHADELQFFYHYFHWGGFPYIPEGHKDASFSKMFIRLWTTFARTGRPSGADNGAVWEPISNPKPFRWFVIGDHPRMTDVVGPRMNYWDQYNETELYQVSSTKSEYQHNLIDLLNYGYFKKSFPQVYG